MKTNREKIITSLLSQFKENISRVSDEHLEKMASGELVISLTQPVGEEAGGATAIQYGLSANKLKI